MSSDHLNNELKCKYSPKLTARDITKRKQLKTAKNKKKTIIQ